ncbi:MAG: hypothetical protein LLG01_05675 [Planctomycetaceae bacterium]|nr:hypothetical protein [Planctomycetaceae bacterium]
MKSAPDNPELQAATADERLVHALLTHLYDEQSAQHRRRRVQRVVEAIAASARPARRVALWARRAAYAAAAMLLAAVGIWVFNTPSRAMASLNDIIGALAKPGDRTYHIAMQDLDEPPPPEGDDRPPRPGDGDRSGPRIPRPGLDDATLYLRDGRQYLLVRRDPNGGVIYDGFDGRQSWRIRRGELAETRQGPGAGGIPMPALMADVPFSDLHQTLERIKVNYTLERLDETALPSGGQLLRHVLVRRNSRQVKGPETIEIWADLHSGLPRRIVFDRAKIQGNIEPCRVTLDLLSDKPLATDWFTPAPHKSRP